MNEQNHSAPLAPEFLEGPWIASEEVIDWFKITKTILRGWRHRGKIAYSDLNGIFMYNKAWILHQLAKGWTWKTPKPRKRRAKDGVGKE